MKILKIIFYLFYHARKFIQKIEKIDRYLDKKYEQYSLYLLSPKFIQKIDRHLLLNNPRIWVTDIHYLVYHKLLVNICLFLLVLSLVNGHPEGIIILNIIIVTAIVCELIHYGFWLERQCLLHLEKEYANLKFTDSLLEIILCIVCTLTLISSSWTMTVTAIYKVAHIAPATCQGTICNSVIMSQSKTFEFCQALEEQIQKKNKNLRIKFCDNIKQFWIDQINNSEEKILEKKLDYDSSWLYHRLGTLIGTFIAVSRKNYCKEIDDNDIQSPLYPGYFYCVLFLIVFVLSLITYSPLILENNNYRNKYIFDLITKSFLAYLCFVPLQKWLFIRTLSLPKK